MRSTLRLWAPVVAWAAVIFMFSSLSGPAPARIARIPDWVTHSIVFGILSFLVCRALSGNRPIPLGAALLGVVLCTLYGISDEWHQSFVAGRESSGFDVLKDLAGAILGAAAYVKLGPSRIRRTTS